ncbi:hypothetical protein, partial [Candidatus Phyllobacterium onerii]|uniref:hypothetical protein n=1 Tax=Candidatus Phyllobacterium onerii TaxID=3020828 RepID=UPI00232AD658
MPFTKNSTVSIEQLVRYAVARLAGRLIFDAAFYHRRRWSKLKVSIGGGRADPAAPRKNSGGAKKKFLYNAQVVFVGT